MNVANELSSEDSADLFGVSNYFQFPSFILIVFGQLGKAIGGITLLNMRTIHALSGLTIILFTYLFFRTFNSPLWAAGGAIIVGSNHALLTISRMAMRDNTGLLVEIIALFALFWGIKNRNLLLSFIGGAVAGLGFYVYEPGRVTIFVWVLFLALAAMFLRKHIKPKALIGLGLATMLGFLIVIAPMAVSTYKQFGKGGFEYQRSQILIFPEGRTLQQGWVFAPTLIGGITTGIQQGLTTFNNKVHDQGYIYVNKGHGFVDPLTGILLWLGALAVLSALFEKKRRPEDLLMLAGFIFLWLLLSSLTRAPNYTRLLITLPFVAYLVMRGIEVIGKELGAEVRKHFSFNPKHLAGILFSTIVLIIVSWNIFIFGGYVNHGFQEGDEVGGTARYVESKNSIDGYSFYLAADGNTPYYSWGEKELWNMWIGFFTAPSQNTSVLNPDDFVSDLHPPFTVFMSQALWKQSGGTFSGTFPEYEKHNITPDARLIAIEVK